MTNDPQIIAASHIFKNINYLVPIYQRNYAWESKQIEQLIEDINSSIDESDKSYFLGSLIVNQREGNIYEVIDGQQRLTTLYLLEKYLKIQFAKDALRFEAREKSNRTLSYISNDSKHELIDELSSQEIIEGFNVIKNYFENKNINRNNFIQKLNQVFLIRVQVPQNIDLNHYFEIMNTRGEQLELHEIAKSKLLGVLETEHDRNVAALIWEKCSDMNSYVQMNFDSDKRKLLFNDFWTDLKHDIKNFDLLKKQIVIGEKSTDKNPLIYILKNQSNVDITLSDNKSQPDAEYERFESTISFPYFLLQVNAVMKKLREDDGISLDDKHFLVNLSWAWKTSNEAKNFLYHLLKCRVLFDKYVLKREFARDYKETGKWSLQRLEKYNDKPNYVGTYGDESQDNKILRTLQSCLRITYTSPKTMHWITVVLIELLDNEKVNLISLLEDYCKKKISDSEYKNKSGFGFERIVFSYLDYLIYKDGYSYNGKIITPPTDWHFQFRSSIEHFYPQHPVEGKYWDQKDLDSFGNLALITISGNSKFSNLPPLGKINSYQSIINQSLKLQIMKEIAEFDNGNWSQEKVNIHKEEMFKIIENNILTLKN